MIREKHYIEMCTYSFMLKTFGIMLSKYSLSNNPSMFTSLNSCISYPPTSTCCFPSRSLFQTPPPPKKKGSDSNSKTPRQIIHQMDALLSQASATVWSLGGVVLRIPPPSGGTCHHPKNRRDLYDFLGPPKLVVIFFC